jgi:integrase
MIVSFDNFALAVLDEREHNGIRGVGQERLRFTKHLATAAFAEKPIDQVKPADVADWLRVMGRKRADDRRGDRPLSRHTIARCLSLASVIFDEAGPQARGLVTVNPCLGMRVKKKEGEKTEEPWTFLTLEEQHAVRTLPEKHRWPILFAIGTGLRQGEQFNLELRDLHVDGDDPHVFVRFGSKGKVPKSGKARRVPLFGVGLEAAREWLRVLPSFCPHNFDQLVFPTATGCRRGQKPLGNGQFIPSEHGTHRIVRGKPKRSADGTHVYVDQFKLAMQEIGIKRNVRWHDLRHTCASSLVSGFWSEDGRGETLEVTREVLGHSSIIVTQRYAHLGETSLKRLAERMRSTGGTTAPPEPSTLQTVSRAVLSLIARVAA